MDLSEGSVASILARDTKEFDLSKKKVIISQVMVPSFTWNRERSDVIFNELAAMRTASGMDIVLALFTSVLDNASDLYGAAETDLMSELFGETLPSRLEGVMSRKKDFVPWFGARLREISRP